VDALEFLIDIGDRTERGYRIRVEAQGDRFTVHVPFDPAEQGFQRMLDELPLALLASSAKARWAADPAEQKVRLLGGELFKALMVDEVPGRLGVTRRQARAEGRDLRLTLRIGPPELAALPWEFMYDPRSHSEEFLSKNFLLVRIPEELAALPPLPLRGPVRILALAACPTDLPALDIEHERRLLTEALAPGVDSGQLEVQWATPTRNGLTAALRQGPWHVFHFVGHGDFRAGSGQGRLMVENSAGTADPIPARALATMLGNHPTLRLAVLNACQSGRGTQSDPYSSTASALIRAGIPAVVAMQYPIGDEAAPLFSQSFYQGLACGQPIDQCVRYGREGIWNQMHTSLEWGTPVLHLRSSNGQIFEVSAAAVASPETFAEPLDPATAYNSAVALRELGDTAGAIAAYRRLIKDWDSEYGPWAAIDLGYILADQGDIAGAEKLYRRLLKAGRTERWPQAANSFAQDLDDQGKTASAQRLFRLAIRSGDPYQAPLAMNNLGVSFDRQGDTDAAIDFYQQALDTGAPATVPIAAYNLGIDLAEQGDIDGAIDAYRQSIETGDIEQASQSALALGDLLTQQGDETGAQEAYREAVDIGHPDAGPRALIQLAASFERQGNHVDARAAYLQAAVSGHTEAGPMAAAILQRNTAVPNLAALVGRHTLDLMTQMLQGRSQRDRR
jgi:tetratricopeptide (TPR) repeat protein